MLKKANFFQQIPADLTEEQFETILAKGQVKIERISSKGQTSPDSGWYQQPQGEWVMLLQGAAELEFEDGKVRLEAGDYLDIPAGVKHKVSWTDPQQVSLWLAVFYPQE